MTRKYPPRLIPAAHAETQLAEHHREQARPARPSTPTPAAAWEATTEPTPAPQPKTGRGRSIKVVVQTPIPPGTVVMQPAEAKALRNMFALARETTTDQSTKARLRRAEDQVVKATRGTKL